MRVIGVIFIGIESHHPAVLDGGDRRSAPCTARSNREQCKCCLMLLWRSSWREVFIVYRRLMGFVNVPY